MTTAFRDFFDSSPSFGELGGSGKFSVASGLDYQPSAVRKIGAGRGSFLVV
jgi:hypothetical protein